VNASTFVRLCGIGDHWAESTWTGDGVFGYGVWIVPVNGVRDLEGASLSADA